MRHEVSEHELLRHLHGELSAARREELDRHLELCGLCRSKRDAWLGLIGRLREPDPRLTSIDLSAGIRGAIRDGVRSLPDEAAHRLRLRWWVALAAGLAILTLTWMEKGGPPDAPDFQPKAARRHPESAHSLGLLVEVIADGRASPAGPQISPGAELSFRYSNPGATGYSYLMILGVDSTRRVRWYYPAYTDPNTDPAAIEIAPSAADVPLPDAVRHDLPAGTLWIIGLFAKSPLTVSQVELRLAKGEWSAASPPVLASTSEEHEERMRLEVR